MKPLTLSTEITIGPCTIRIMGKRSTKGWTIHADGKLQGERKSKKDAIQLAEDACEPGVRATFTVQPREVKA